MRGPLYDAIRNGCDEEAKNAWATVENILIQYERLRGHAVPAEEIEKWRRLYREKFSHLSKRAAAEAIRAATDTLFSENTIRYKL